MEFLPVVQCRMVFPCGSHDLSSQGLPVKLNFIFAVRTALLALIAFMPTNPGGALGSLDYKKEDRRALAIKSREAPPKFGSPERQKLIDEVNSQSNLGLKNACHFFIFLNINPLLYF